MERSISGRIIDVAAKIKRPAEVGILTFAIATGVNPASPAVSKTDYINPVIISQLISQTKEMQTIENVECTTEPIFPSQPKINLNIQTAFTNDDTVPCVEIDYSDGSGVIFLSPFAYTHTRKGSNGTNIFPTLCELPGIAEPIYGQETAPDNQDLSGIPSYCVYPPIEKDKSNTELLPLAPYKPNQIEKQFSI